MNTHETFKSIFENLDREQVEYIYNAEEENLFIGASIFNAGVVYHFQSFDCTTEVEHMEEEYSMCFYITNDDALRMIDEYNKDYQQYKIFLN